MKRADPEGAVSSQAVVAGSTVGLLREICGNYLRVPLQISLFDGNVQVKRSAAIKGTLADLYILVWMGCSSWRGFRQRSVKVKGTLGRSLPAGGRITSFFRKTTRRRQNSTRDQDFYKKDVIFQKNDPPEAG